MQIRNFENASQMQAHAVRLLTQYLSMQPETPTALMLSGGKTPLAIYNTIRDHPVKVGSNWFITFSDERMVPADSVESNYANARAMIEALAIPEERVIRVHTELPLHEAAQQFHSDLSRFMEHGKVALGLLGVGSDGHTASLFSLNEANHLHDRYAIAVPKEPAPDRVSVTPDFLRRIERIIFLAAGPDKKEIIEHFICAPHEIPAGAAVAGVKNVELWHV